MNENKRPQKRWESESQIMDEIHRIKASQNQLIRDSRESERAGKAFYVLAESTSTLLEHREGYRQEGHKKIKESKELAASASRRDAMLKTVGQKLAAFRTQPMAFMDDVSVV